MSCLHERGAGLRRAARCHPTNLALKAETPSHDLASADESAPMPHQKTTGPLHPDSRPTEHSRRRGKDGTDGDAETVSPRRAIASASPSDDPTHHPD